MRKFVAEQPFGEVYAFADLRSAEAYVENDPYNRAIIRKKDIGGYVARPRPFSGQRRLIEISPENEGDISGFIGRVICDYPDTGGKYDWI